MISMRCKIDPSKIINNPRTLALFKLFTKYQANGKIPYSKTKRLYRRVKRTMAMIRSYPIPAPHLTSNRLS